MTTRQYIGARYVPIFADPVEWDNTRTYEHLMMVQHQGETYISQQAVPIGIDLPDTSQGEESNAYWVHMSNWNAQIETYRQEVLQYNGRISEVENDLPIADFDSTNTVKKAIDSVVDILPGSNFDSTNTVKKAIDDVIDLLPGSDFDSTNTVKKYIDESIIQDETKARVYSTVAEMKADTTLENGMICHTDGFHASNDGGAAWYEIKDTGTANEMDVIACGNLFANLIIEDSINILQFGAYGDGTTDDFNSINRAVQVAIANKLDIIFPEGRKFLVSQTVEIASEINVIMNSPIIYKGASIALKIGEKSTQYANNRYFKIMVDSDSHNTIKTGSIGVQMIGIVDSIIELILASGFETNAMFWAYDVPFAYNHIKLGRLTYGQTQLLMQVDDAEHTNLYGWMNENLFTDGRFASASSNPYVNQWTGIKIVSYNNNQPNNNIFIKPNFEGALYCVDIVTGSNNQFLNARSENCTYAMKVAENFKASCNYFEAGYGSESVYPNSGAGNLAVNRYYFLKQRMNNCVYDSGYLCNRSFSNGSYLYCGSEIFYYDGTNITQIYKGTKESDGVSIVGRMLGVRIKCTENKTFLYEADTEDSATFGLCLVLRDSNGDIISTEKSIIGYDNVTYTGNSGTTISGVYSYPASATNRTQYLFTINDNSVAYVDVLMRAINKKVKRIRIYAPSNSKNEIIYGVVNNGLNAIPTCTGKVGDYCPNGNSSSIASTLGWVYDGTNWSAVNR